MTSLAATSVRFRILALAACGGIVLAGCGSAAQPSATPTSSAAESSAASAASDSGSTGGPAIVVKSGGSESSSGVPAIVPGNLDLSALPSTCTNEGVILLPINGQAKPALDGFTGALVYTGWNEGQGATSTANFTVDQGSGAQKFGPLHLGDQFTLGGAKYSVTSICADNAELDKIG